MSKIKHLTKEQAIKIIDKVFEKCFGDDKGSFDSYCEFMEEQGFPELDEKFNVIKEVPMLSDIYMALGITPKERRIK